MTTPRCELWNEDCITGMASRLRDDSVHLVVSSIPFEELFHYSGKLEDVGNNGSTVDVLRGRFALNLRFVADQLLRVLAHGCLCCIHVQQLLAYKNQHGFIGRRHFTAAVVDVFAAAGFHWTGEFIIQKDPQAIANRLSLHSLQFRTGRERTSTMLAPVFNDYVLLFQKPGDCVNPVRPFHHPRKNPRGWIMPDATGVICPEWVRDAHGVWTDINELDVLDDAAFIKGKRGRSRGEGGNEKHVCPLQLSVILRLVRLYSNPISIQPDVLVLDPFMGIGSTAFVCVGGKSPVTKLGLEEPRNVVGFELKDSYHKASLQYVERAIRKDHSQQSMFT